jgi:2-polyprenyl-3-methyl-5-hydroxy-6-metoxy-1,4-benzoquinol methylase
MPTLLYDCPLCNSSRLKPYSARFRINAPHILRVICKECGLIFANPQATYAELKMFYQEYYDKGNFIGSKNELIHWKKKYNDGVISKETPLFERLLELGNSNWLDIGAGLGRLSYIASTNGYMTTQTEVDEDAVQFLKKEMGFSNVLVGDLNDLYPIYLKEQAYDVIILYHSLEHIINLGRTMEIVYKLLKPGGYLYIGVPNLGNIAYHIHRNLNFIANKIPDIVDGIEHTYAFTPKTLSSCLSRHTFTDIRIRTHGKLDGYLSIVKREKSMNKRLVAIAESFFHTRMECLSRKPHVNV